MKNTPRPTIVSSTASLNMLITTILLSMIISTWGFSYFSFVASPISEKIEIFDTTRLYARKKMKNKRRTKSDNNHKLNNAATNQAVATVAGVSEDHRFEQFFYDEPSTRRLYKIVTEYSHPLLLCNPSLALLAEKDYSNKNEDSSYLLLDRDTRFNFLSQYKEFYLTEPFLVTSFPYNVVFIDPPFANITPSQLVKCLRRMAPDAEKSSVPVYIAYNSEREQQLLAAFEEYPGPKLEKKWRLGYRSVSEDTQDKIWLYGPVGNYPF